MTQVNEQLERTLGDRSSPPRRTSVVLASGPTISTRTQEELRARPVEDFTVIGQLYDATIVDPAVAVRSRPARVVDRVLGTAWVVAFRAVREARKADALIAMGDDVGVYAALFKWLLRCRTPLVVICLNLRSRRARLAFGRLGLQRQVQRFLPYSTGIRDVLVDEYGVSPDRIDMLHNTVDHRYFDGDDERADPRQIASAGLALRDYPTLLAATRGLDATVKIEANSAWFAQSTTFAPEDLHEGVELCNDGTTAGLREIYATSAIIVVPLLEVGEPAGNTTILEGMAMRKPVVASNISMGSDHIIDGETGFLVPPGDVGALRACLEMLLADADLRHRIGLAARQAVEDEFTREHYAQRIAQSVSLALAAR
jgi:glycosyltransferase involved in cell wall biosynthesis